MSLKYQKLAKSLASYFLIFTLTCIVQLHSFAQDGTFLGTEITSLAEEEYDQVFENFNIYELNSVALDGFVKDEDYDSQVRLNFANTFDWDMVLFENDIRGEKYILRAATENGIETLAKDPVITYSGYLRNDPLSEIRLTIKDNFIYGYIQQGKTTNFIEPANRFSKSAADNHYIIYDALDVKEDSEKKCGVTDIQDSGKIAAPEQNGEGRSLACKRLELAIASDYSYMVARGGEVGDAVAAALAVMNNVQGDYNGGVFNDNIEFEIVEQFVSTCGLCDPWTTSTDASVLLGDFRNWGNAGGFSSGTGHDLGQLWTARDICYQGSCGVIGLASVGVVCNSFRYHVLEDFSTNATSLRVLTSHEIGHNFNLSHDASESGFIMAPSVNNTSTWSPLSISTFNTFVAGISCLDGCSAVTCDRISNLDIQLTNTTSPQINLSWTGTVAGNYRIRVREENTNVDIFTQNTTLTNINITPPLESCKKYEVIVEADCGGGNYSNPTVGLIINLAVASPNGGETLTTGNNETIRWFVNAGGTDCNLVDILLSLDGGNTFPIILADDTANDGNEILSIPVGISATTEARIKVTCANTCTSFEAVSNANFTISSTCNAQASFQCPTVTVSADQGTAATNLNINKISGNTITNKTFNVLTTDAHMDVVTANPSNGCLNHNFRLHFGQIEFTVDQSGMYNFTGSFADFIIINLFQNSFDPDNPCSTWLTSNIEDEDGNPFGRIGGFTGFDINLTECTTYYLTVSQYSSDSNFSGNISLSGIGNITEIQSTAAGTEYSYIAVNQSNNTIIAQSATADFTTLPGGGTVYSIYGVSYNNSETPSNWIGLTQSTLTNGSRCLLLSNNSSMLTVTGNAPCSNPTPSLGTTTNPTTCGGTEGSIQLTGLTANTSYTLNYKKDNIDATVVNFTANNAGQYTLSNLGAGVYSAINVTISTCTSANLGPTTLSDPADPSVDAIGNQTVTAGEMTAAINFSGTGSSYTWTNNNTSIGLADASGTGNIGAFMTMNSGVATIEVTPILNGCSGPSKTFTITVNSASGTCTDGMLNVDTSIDNETYTCDTVSSTETIPANFTIIYEGCSEITLEPGFHAVATSTFTARIVNCAPLTSPDNNISQARINSQNTTIPTSVVLSVHPNPARDFAMIDYQLAEAASVSIRLFDMTGKELAIIAPRQSKDQGIYQQRIALGDFNGGMYFVVLQTEKEQISKKMIILK